MVEHAVTSHDHPLTFEDVLRTQDGVIRPDDVALWISRREVRHEVDAGRWRMPHRGVYVTHNSTLTRAQERWVCLLAAPHGAVLGGLTAAEIDGLRGFTVPEVFVVVPPGSRRPRRAGLAVRFSRRLGSADVHPLRLPRRTRPARSLVDAASWAPKAGQARVIVLAGVQQRLVRGADLRDALSRRGPCRRHALIVESIVDAEGGVASLPERDFEQIRRQFGLPEPRRQAVLKRTDKRFYLDVDWKRYGVAVEIHGVQHMEVPSWDADLERQAVITARGRRVMQFTSFAVRHDRARVGALLVEALRTGGWRG